ncbi:DUF1553 domain-containing protein [Symmachiella dynata]|uniref:DUF1553 domain-containing protein n=1 Tax=Symmachiella dynata TaxID=2527995 RepID=UPI0030EBDDA0
MRRCLVAGILVASMWASPNGMEAADPVAKTKPPTARQLEFFEKKIRPLLAARCFKCHGEEKVQGGLRLDSQAAFLIGGDSGEIFDPAAPQESLFLEAISYDPDAIVEMPPDGRLSDAEIALLTKWIGEGAPWPPSAGPAPVMKKEDGPLFTEEEKKFWAFQPIHAPQVPAVQRADWPRLPLDNFVLSQLEAQGLSPAPEAEKRVWLRRVTFDLCGLPPTPQEIADFEADDSADAYERAVDRLLASPRYGERWGRHWLDVARYADSNGMDENLAYANAFRYRDYVIAAFNKDKPFDQFLIEQIAGDLMPAVDDAETTIERQVATGFLAIGPKMLAEDDPLKMRVDIVDEQVETIGRAFMGMTIGCARCHDHKFDPVPQADYYSLAGIFMSTKTMENYKVVANWYERPLASPAAIAKVKQQEQLVKDQEAALTKTTRVANRKLVAAARKRVGDYLIAATELLRYRAADQALVSILQPNPMPLPDGGIVVEAEDYTRGNLNKDFSNYGTKIGVLVNGGKLPNFVEYEIDVPAPGRTYQFEIRLAAAQSRPVKLSINGKPSARGVAEEVTGSWTPDSQKWHAESVVALEPGKNVIRLERDGPFPHIDKIGLLPLQAEGNFPLGPEELAKKYDLKLAFLNGWADYLEKTKSDSSSVLAQWHALSSSQTVKDNDLFSDFRNESRQRLATRYSELFAKAQMAWRELKDGDQEAKQLPDAELEAFRQVLHDKKGPFAVSEKLEADYSAETMAVVQNLRDEIKELKASIPEFPLGMGVTEDEIQNTRINIRGNHINLGDEVPRQFLQVIAGEQQTPIGKERSGRLELGKWMTSPDHPLTSRVIVNRVWRWHFGKGIVPTPDNFGSTGELPVNQPLLDHLAAEFIERGWGLKDLHRRLVLSATYRMSTRYDAAAVEQDPGNVYMWRMNRRRLTAEELRDAVLSIAGTMDSTMGGTLLPTKNHAYVASTASVNATPYESTRRSVYLPVIRSGLFEMFQAFDFPDPSTSNGDRATTTVAPQALFLLNSDFMAEQTEAMARDLLSRDGLDDAARLDWCYRRTLGRGPSSEETAQTLEFLTNYIAAMEQRVPDAQDRQRQAWQGLCRVLLSSSEFLYVD